MDADELLRLLDLGARPAPAPDGALPCAPDPTPPNTGAPASPTALEVDAWGLRRGRDLIAESERLRAAGADAFAAAFEPDPRLTAGCTAPLRHRFLAQLLDTPEYRALHADTRLDDTAAAIAAGHFAEQFAQLPSAPGGSAPSPEPGGEMAAELVALRATGVAVAAARTEVRELRDAASALGLGPGSPGANDPRAIAALFRRVRNDPGLRRVCALAGRFRRVAQSQQRQKASHGWDDVIGVEPGGELARLLPSELARVAVPELELDTLRRLVEGHALCRAHHTIEPAGKGPIVVVCDESGSMEGIKAHTAKALALALAWVARSQGRWCALVAYSGGSGERLLALPPGRWDEAALCEWVAAFIGRGSDLDLPVTELPRMYRQLGAPVGATDVVLITDAEARIPAPLRDAFNAWRRTVRARVFALVLASRAGDLEAISDEVHPVPALDPNSDAVGRVLAL